MTSSYRQLLSLLFRGSRSDADLGMFVVLSAYPSKSWTSYALLLLMLLLLMMMMLVLMTLQSTASCCMKQRNS